MNIIASIPFFMTGFIFLLIGFILLKKVDYSDWKHSTGKITDIRDEDYDYDGNVQRSSAAYLIIEFTDELGQIRKGKSNHIGTLKDVRNVKEKYKIGQEISFIYKIDKESLTYKLFTKIFNREPFVVIHIEDNEFVEKNFFKYLITLLGLGLCVLGLLVTFNVI